MLTLATIHGSLRVADADWTIDTDGFIRKDGIYAAGWSGTKLAAVDQAPYLLGTDGQWHRWSGETWTYVGTLPPETVVASAPSSLMGHDGVWTLGPHGEVLKDDARAQGGTGVEIYTDDDGLYVRSDDGSWWAWWDNTWHPADAPGGPITPPDPDLAQHQARSAWEFIDSIGVTTHLNYLDTAYYKEWPKVRDLLIESGIQHVREGIPRMDQWYYDRVAEWGDAGVNFLALLGKATPEELDTLVENMPNVYAIEGLNEWDLSGDPDWAAFVRSYQPKLFKAAKKHCLTVLGPSLTSGAAFDAVGDLSQSMDIAQIHNYFGTRNPETWGWGDDGYGSLDWHERQSAKIAPGVSIWTVETGYATDPGHDPRMADQDLPEAACVRYLSRLLCFQFAEGLDRTYIYQFVEDFQSNGPVDAFATFGLVRSDATPKATYHAVKNLITLLHDEDDAEPGTLQYAVGDAPNLRQLLLQKSDGSFWLALWLGAESMDPHTRQMRPDTTAAVSLQVASTYEARGAYTLGDDGYFSPPQAVSGSLVVSDRLTIVHIAARG